MCDIHLNTSIETPCRELITITLFWISSVRRGGLKKHPLPNSQHMILKKFASILRYQLQEHVVSNEKCLNLFKYHPPPPRRILCIRQISLQVALCCVENIIVISGLMEQKIASTGQPLIFMVFILDGNHRVVLYIYIIYIIYIQYLSMV